MNAKLLFCIPPPDISDDEFNEQTRQIALARAIGKKRAPTTRVVKNADTYIAPSSTHTTDGAESLDGIPVGKTGKVDQEFFQNDSSMSPRPFVQGSTRDGQEFTRSRIYPHQNVIADDGTPLTGRRARIAAVLANAGDVAPGKKHHKKMKRVKQRSGKGYD